MANTRQSRKIHGRDSYQHQSEIPPTRSRNEKRINKKSPHKESFDPISTSSSSSDEYNSDLEQDAWTNSQKSNKTKSPPRTFSPNRIHRSPQRGGTLPPAKQRSYSPESFRASPRQVQHVTSCGSSSGIGPILLGGFLVLVAIYVVSGMFSQSGEVKRNCDQFESLKKNFPKQDPYMWRALKVGIESVLNNRPPKPSIFLFLHHDENSTETIVNDIVKTAAHCFDSKLQAVTLGSEQFSTEDVIHDYGIVIEWFRKTLHNGGVLLIADLNNIPPPAARALHFICDNESPMIRNVVIFLTLRSNSSAGKPVQIAEDTLNSIWSPSIDSNTLGALITRITDQVLLLNPE